MANCCICGKKLGLLSGESFSVKYNYLFVCEKCSNNRVNLRVSKAKKTNPNEILASREYFCNCINSGTVVQEIMPILNNMLKESVFEEEKSREYHEREQNFQMTTSYNFEGYNILKYLNVVTAETVLGTGFLSELSSQISDVLGTNSGLFEEKIANAKDASVKKLIEKSLNINANGLIGICFSMMTLSNNIIVVSVSGTAVVINKI